jgi:hypothetical protein
MEGILCHVELNQVLMSGMHQYHRKKLGTIGIVAMYEMYPNNDGLDKHNASLI